MVPGGGFERNRTDKYLKIDKFSREKPNEGLTLHNRILINGNE